MKETYNLHTPRYETLSKMFQLSEHLFPYIEEVGPIVFVEKYLLLLLQLRCIIILAKKFKGIGCLRNKATKI